MRNTLLILAALGSFSTAQARGFISGGGDGDVKNYHCVSNPRVDDFYAISLNAAGAENVFEASLDGTSAQPILVASDLDDVTGEEVLEFKGPKFSLKIFLNRMADDVAGGFQGLVSAKFSPNGRSFKNAEVQCVVVP